VISSSKPTAPDAINLMKWKAPEGKIYFIRIHAFDDHLAGTNTYYKVSVQSEGLTNLPWKYIVMVVLLLPLGFGGYKVVKYLQAKRAAVPAAGYAAETRGIPLSFSDNLPPLPRKQHIHKNFDEVMTSLIIWTNRTTRNLFHGPGPRKLTMARRPRRL